MTITQLYKHPRQHKQRLSRIKHLQHCPQKRALCLKMMIMTPRKPCSAKRKVAKIFLLSNKYRTFGYIPGERHNLQKFSQVLIRGGFIRDLPGIHYTIIRGKLDLAGILLRRQGRSKYGTKLWFRVRKKERRVGLLRYKVLQKKIWLSKFEKKIINNEKKKN